MQRHAPAFAYSCSRVWSLRPATVFRYSYTLVSVTLMGGKRADAGASEQPAKTPRPPAYRVRHAAVSNLLRSSFLHPCDSSQRRTRYIAS